MSRTEEKTSAIITCPHGTYSMAVDFMENTLTSIVFLETYKYPTTTACQIKKNLHNLHGTYSRSSLSPYERKLVIIGVPT